MTTYAVGDLQGCLAPLKRLLAKVDFNPSKDTLWVAGDLINRGPASLKTLQYLYKLDSACQIVLGNHDLHFLAIEAHATYPRPKDTFGEILAAPERSKLASWLRQQPLVHSDNDLGYTMVHAGIPPQWTVKKALKRAAEVEQVLKDKGEAKIFFKNMYGNQPNIWHKSLVGTDRLRVITNYFTRMRFCSAQGHLELETKTGTEQAPEGFAPWFSHPNHACKNDNIIFGHWAALNGVTEQENFIGLDTGCVWGGSLCLYNLKSQEKTFEDCGC